MTAPSTDAVGSRPPAVLNGRYPSSWWAVGFSDEVERGEVVPVRVLERDVILWRDTGGTLHCHSGICPHLGANIGYGGEVVGDTVRCPFHGYRYDCSGAVCERVGEDARAPARLALQRYTVEERYGTMFVWNGCDPPDHGLPDLATVFPEKPDLEPSGISCFHFAFYHPFPAKWFIENIPDANHFGALHRVCDFGSEPEIVEETPSTLRVILRLKNPKPFLTWENFREHVRLGQVLNPVALGGEFDQTTYGGGVHIVKLAPSDVDEGKVGQFIGFLDSAKLIISWTPVEEISHVIRYTFLMPRIPVPGLARALEPILNYLISKRIWPAIVHDISVMRHRRELPNPVYGRLDRGLVRFRRFWDSRILDRSLWAGDNTHSNGMRAGIKWEDRPAPDQPALAPVGESR